MVTKNQIKLITSLQQKKFRETHQLFLAEGAKVIQELLQSDYDLAHLYQTTPLFTEIPTEKCSLVSENELQKMSALTVANNCLAIFKIPKPKPIIEKGLILALDDIRDPGNLGTILRLCDWFGVQQLLCSQQTVDLYNPKVVQATMGSISRVNVTYLDLDAYLSTTKQTLFGTFMDGENLYKTTLKKEGILIMGNEANGISAPIEQHIKTRLTIPRFGQLQQTESLNVATATAIFLSEFRR